MTALRAILTPMSARAFPTLSLLVAAIVLAAAPLRAADEPRVVVGRVVDDKGIPLAGVLVEYGHYYDGPEKRESTTTNVVGRYRLAATTVGRGYRLGFSKPGCAPQWIDDVIPGPADRPKQLDVQLVAGTRVAVEFRNRAGQPVPGVKFTIATASNGYHSSFSYPTPSTPLPGPRREWVADAAGRATLDSLPAKPLEAHRRQDNQSDNWLQVNVRTSSGGGYYDQNITEEAILGGDPVVITLPDWQLPRDPAVLRGVVRARVVDAATGQPIPRYTATVRHRPDMLAIDDPDGRFSYGDKLEFGRKVQVRIFAPGYAVAVASIAGVAPEDEALPEIRLAAHASFEGRLVDATTNQPLAGVAILAGHTPERSTKYIIWGSLDEYADGNHCLSNVVRVTTDAQGRFTVPEAPDQPVHLVVLHLGYERRVFLQTARPEADGDGVVTFALQRAATITAVAIRQTPAGAGAKKVSLGFLGGQRDGFDYFGISAPVDDEGRAEFDSLPAGAVRLHVGGAAEDTPRFSRKVTLEAGQHKTVLLGAMPGALRLYGRAPPLATITVRPKFETEFDGFAIQADADGRFELTHLLPGKYGLRVNDSSPVSGFIPDEPEITIDLQQDSELDLLTRARRKVLGQ
jgi:hypothetical protein